MERNARKSQEKIKEMTFYGILWATGFCLGTFYLSGSWVIAGIVFVAILALTTQE